MTRNHLARTLAQLPSSAINACVSGHCDAFAQALVQYLEEAGTPASVMICERTRIDDTGATVDYNPFSHVVVEALDTCWDATGAQADERWESEWIAPGDGDVDYFDWEPTTLEKIQALRMKRDQREVDPKWQGIIRNHLDGATVAVRMKVRA